MTKADLLRENRALRILARARIGRCEAGRDGECNAKKCPQKDNYLQWCALAEVDDEETPNLEMKR